MYHHPKDVSNHTFAFSNCVKNYLRHSGKMQACV